MQTKMKTKIAMLCIFLVLFLGGCADNISDQTSTVSATFDIMDTEPRSLATAQPTATITPSPEFTTELWRSPTPETLYGYPTSEPAAMPTCDPFEGCMLNLTPDVQQKELTFNELYVGDYVLRKWCNENSRLSSMPDCAVSISSQGVEQVLVWGLPARFGNETGAYLTGNTTPDIVLINWTGGNCCVETIMYEAGDQLEPVMDIWSYRVGTFIDLNGDETYEYIAPYRNFSRSFSQCTLWTSIVYEYQPAQRQYLPATDKFKDVLTDRIQWASDFLIEYTAEYAEVPFLFINHQYDENNSAEEEIYWKYVEEYPQYSLAVNAIYELTAYYLLIGEKENAQDVLDTYFSPEQADEYMLGIMSDVERYLAP